MTIDLMSGTGTGLAFAAPLAALDGAWGIALLCAVSGAYLLHSSFRRKV